MDFEKATLRKAAVSTLPLWAESEQESLEYQQRQHRLSSTLGLSEENHDHAQQSQSKPPGAASPPSLLPLSNSTTFASGSGTGSGSTGRYSTSSSRPFNTTVANTSAGNGAPSSTGSGAGLVTGSGSVSAPNPAVKLLATVHSSSSTARQHPQDWSIFATMSNVSTISELSHKHHGSRSPGNNLSVSDTIEAMGPGSGVMSSLRKFPLKLDELFKTQSTGSAPIDAEGNGRDICTCTCAQHKRGGSNGGRLGASASKRRNQKESRESTRGYPTGQCVSTDPPEETTWDEKDSEQPLTHRQQRLTSATNTAFNLGAMKAFLNSPLFSNFLKSLTVMAAVSLFAIALDAIIILVKAPDQATQLTNDNTALIVTVILSLMTIAYSCFTIFLESRRPPEGLDASNSKPLIVIFSEIIATIIWAQVLSVTIYIYIWTYGCTAAGERQLEMLWKQDFADQHLTAKLCRRQGAMVGLELLLVVLIIFNFYTHLAQNFKFIRAVSS